ncbi:MAG: PFL family protein [Muribaculaceae bacterium]
MINILEVTETNQMIEQENLDVRTITMGINLLDCADSDLNNCCKKIYNKITTYAKNLVKTGNDIASEFGIPIVNKRISITPISLVGASCCKTPADYVTIARTLDRAAKAVGINFMGGYSAIVSKGMTPSDEMLIRSIPQALAETDLICSSVNVGSTKTGIDMDAVRLMGDIIKETAELTKDRDSIGCAKLVVLCNAPDDNPFMAGAFHGVSEADAIINVGVSGPGVVKHALQSIHGESFEMLCETIKRTAFKITRVGQLVAQEASRRLNVPFGIIDLSLAPTPAVGDSVADILHEMGLEHAGAPGTTAALALLNDQVKKGGVMASSYVGGLSGAFIPVSEDQGMINAVNAGALTIEKLEAMTCVCSVGLDMIAIPGNTPATTIAGIIADESAIGMINQKTTAVRIIPVIGKNVGDTVEFGGLLGYAPIMPVNKFDCSAFVNRCGRIPAPIHSFKNYHYIRPSISGNI